MKLHYIVYILLAMAGILSGCEKDNFDPPKATLKGRVVYQDQPIGVRTPNVNADGTASNGVQLELWQPGFQVYSKIPVFVNQDGSFSASVFDGNYKLVLLRGTGPWVDNSDTINVQVKGSSVVDVPVEPYYIIRNEQFQKAGDIVTATCNVQQVSPSRAIERVTLYLGATQFVDVNNNDGKIDITAAGIADLNQPLSFSLPIPAKLTSKGYFYGRIGVKTVGVAEMLYTPVQKIQL